ncbi:hypothetical protein NQ315_011891 [Exocentrus adspersus]|uniref:Uncharacterized protein n=1 Tax=Exocentrus adspersus TaxID=1586481 RepID=A0AAV8W120_9CUCU|nr:hypothetical protein NQ315_011891 [Exocentrus adspersus]
MATNFITEFHNIQGVSVGERQKNLNKLLTNLLLTEDEEELLLNNLKPKTYLENIFYVDVLIHLKEANRLLEILKDGKGIFVSRIMKQPWFFQEVFGNIDAKELVNHYLPLLSFTVRIKLLRKLSQLYSEEKVDQVFDCVTVRYGLSVATTFITACSSGKIAEVLKKNKLILSTPQLKALYKKDPKLIYTYIEEQHRYGNKKILSDNFLTYLAQKDPVYFWDLIEKFKLNSDVRLGRRTTKKVMVPKKQDIVTDPNKYVKYLRHDALVRKLNKQGNFKQLYSNLFPRDVAVLDEGEAFCNDLLKYYPKKYQYDLFANTFTDVIKEDIWQYPDCVNENMLKIINNEKVRAAWAEMKHRESNNPKYLQFYEKQKSVALIKEKINITAKLKQRFKLIGYLVNACGVNKDLTALEEVLKYFCMRHRNENATMRGVFLRELQDSFDLEKLGSVHWKYIGEIFAIQNLNKEFNWFNSYLKAKYVEHLLNNESQEEKKSNMILNYITEELLLHRLNFNGLNKINNNEMKKLIFQQTLEHIDAIIKSESVEHNEGYLKSQILAHIFAFNLKYPKNKINIEGYETVIKFLTRVTEEEIYVSATFKKYFPRIVCKLNRNEFENQLLDFCLKSKLMKQFPSVKPVRWVLQNDPSVAVNNFSAIMELSPPKDRRVCSFIQKYSHISLDEKVIQYCLQQLNHGDEQVKSSYILPLSVLSTSKSYVKIMEDLKIIPTSSKIDLDDEEVKKMYQIQETFIKNFKNVEDPLNYLPLLMDKFCRGDYLRDALTPLYYAFYAIPKHALSVFLHSLRDTKAMSVKKHALFLACCVFSQEKVIQVCNDFQGDKNESLQKILSLRILRYFASNPTEELFKKVLLYMKFIKEHDTESLKLLTSIHVPKSYKPIFISKVWDLLENLKTSEKAVGFGTLMTSVLQNIDRECLCELPEDLCRTIINNYFVIPAKTEDQKVSGIFEFVIKYLLLHESTEQFTYVFKLLSNYKLKFWDLKGEERKTIYVFYKVFYTIACEAETSLSFIIKFAEEWGKIFSFNDAFKEHVLLTLLQLKKQADGDLQELSKLIVQFVEDIHANSGELIFLKLIPVLADFLVSEDNEHPDAELSELLTNVLKYKTSPVTCILVMEIISFKGNLLYKNKVKSIYREIISKIKDIDDPKVQLCYNLFSKVA